jgi:DNA-binding CsgD family transcriptional regulator
VSELRQEVEKHIRKLILPLKEENELREVLKLRLTKKEFKLLQSWVDETSKAEISEKLNLDEEKYKELSNKVIKKLNQEKLKQEMMVGL